MPEDLRSDAAKYIDAEIAKAVERERIRSAADIDRLRRALLDLVGGMETLKLSDKLPGPCKRAWEALGVTDR